MTSLTNPLATVSQLRQKQAAWSSVDESVFVATQCLTQAAGQLLDLPQSVTAQANVLVARYWLVDSPTTHEFSDVSAAAIYLVAKIGPAPRSPRDVANVYAYLLSPVSSLFKPGTMDDDDDDDDPKAYYQSEAEYTSFKAELFALEARILYALSFDTHVALPHALAITYLQTLDFLSQPKAVISRRTVAYLNTALLSPQMLYLTHQPHALAVAAIYNAAKDLAAKMPDCEWWEVFDVEREDLGFLVVAMRSVEGWLRRRKDEAPSLFQRMPTRAVVEAELQSSVVDPAPEDPS